MTYRAIPTLIAAAIAAAGIGGCASWHHDTNTASNEPHRTATRTTADAAITAKVKTAFAADELVKAHNINVDTVNGVVSLNGMVGSAAERDRAIQLARNVSGVTDVRSNLKTSG